MKYDKRHSRRLRRGLSARGFFWKILPYVASICAGVGFYVVAGLVGGKLEALLIHLSAVFFAITLIFLTYELTKDFSHRKLNKEILDYTKAQIDREVFSVMGQVSKMIHTYEQEPTSGTVIGRLPFMSEEDLRSLVSRNRYLGFQLFKSWDASLKYLREILGNSFMARRLDDQQVLHIISMMKGLQGLEDIRESNSPFEAAERKVEGHRIVTGRELSASNVDLPDRLLLLKDMGEGKFVVKDFGDFRQYDKDKLLDVYAIVTAQLDDYVERLWRVISSVRDWIVTTGSRLIFR
jgi:hypothetical protein